MFRMMTFVMKETIERAKSSLFNDVGYTLAHWATCEVDISQERFKLFRIRIAEDREPYTLKIFSMKINELKKRGKTWIVETLSILTHRR